MVIREISMMNELNIKEAYLTLNFTNKAYTFYLGSIDIKENHLTQL